LVVPVRVIPQPQDAQTAIPVSSEGPLTTRGGVLFGLLLASFAWPLSKSACSIRAGTGIWMTVDGSYLRPSRELRTPYGHRPVA
jgi:hypothetical protein